MREKLAKLIDVKTIITFGLLGATIVLAFQGKIEPKEISMLSTTAIGFFFGTKMQKQNT